MSKAEARSKKTEDRSKRTEVRQKTTVGRLLLLLCVLASYFLLIASAVPAQEDPLKVVEEKRLELKDREDTLKREELRLAALKKDVEEKIQAYTDLLARVESALKRVDTVKGEKIENVVKAYEAMPAEDAATRLAVLDNETALLIMTRMKSKKVGAAIALMDPHKAAALTKSMTTLVIKNKAP